MKKKFKNGLQQLIADNPGMFVDTIKSLVFESMRESHRFSATEAVSAVLITSVDDDKFSKLVSEMPDDVFHEFHRALAALAIRNVTKDFSEDYENCKDCEHKDECENFVEEKSTESIFQFGIKINPEGGEN